MNKTVMLVAIALLLSACVPITPDPVTPTPATAEAVCSHRTVSLLPGQSANDPVDLVLPDYIDIIRVETSLEGETLTAIFYLRNIPEMMEFGRKGVENNTLEYMWSVQIDAEGDSKFESEQEEPEFWLLVSHAVSKVSENARSLTRPVKNAVDIMLWRQENSSHSDTSKWFEVIVYQQDLFISHEEGTLTLVSEVPGITSESKLWFSTYDFWHKRHVAFGGVDDLSCLPE